MHHHSSRTHARARTHTRAHSPGASRSAALGRKAPDLCVCSRVPSALAGPPHRPQLPAPRFWSPRPHVLTPAQPPPASARTAGAPGGGLPTPGSSPALRDSVRGPVGTWPGLCTLMSPRKTGLLWGEQAAEEHTGVPAPLPALGVGLLRSRGPPLGVQGTWPRSRGHLAHSSLGPAAAQTPRGYSSIQAQAAPRGLHRRASRLLLPAQPPMGPGLTLLSSHSDVRLRLRQARDQEQSKKDHHFQWCRALDMRSRATWLSLRLQSHTWCPRVHHHAQPFAPGHQGSPPAPQPQREPGVPC